MLVLFFCLVNISNTKRIQFLEDDIYHIIKRNYKKSLENIGNTCIFSETVVSDFEKHEFLDYIFDYSSLISNLGLKMAELFTCKITIFSFHYNLEDKHINLIQTSIFTDIQKFLRKKRNYSVIENKFYRIVFSRYQIKLFNNYAQYKAEVNRNNKEKKEIEEKEKHHYFIIFNKELDIFKLYNYNWEFSSENKYIEKKKQKVLFLIDCEDQIIFEEKIKEAFSIIKTFNAHSKMFSFHKTDLMMKIFRYTFLNLSNAISVCTLPHLFHLTESENISDFMGESFKNINFLHLESSIVKTIFKDFEPGHQNLLFEIFLVRYLPLKIYQTTVFSCSLDYINETEHTSQMYLSLNTRDYEGSRSINNIMLILPKDENIKPFFSFDGKNDASEIFFSHLETMYFYIFQQNLYPSHSTKYNANKMLKDIFYDEYCAQIIFDCLGNQPFNIIENIFRNNNININSGVVKIYGCANHQTSNFNITESLYYKYLLDSILPNYIFVPFLSSCFDHDFSIEEIIDSDDQWKFNYNNFIVVINQNLVDSIVLIVRTTPYLYIDINGFLENFDDFIYKIISQQSHFEVIGRILTTEIYNLYIQNIKKRLLTFFNDLKSSICFVKHDSILTLRVFLNMKFNTKYFLSLLSIENSCGYDQKKIVTKLNNVLIFYIAQALENFYKKIYNEYIFSFIKQDQFYSLDIISRKKLNSYTTHSPLDLIQEITTEKLIFSPSKYK